ncbi:MAG: M28 family peptidase [Desulfobacterales bacterium]|nr:M28 family peptidase [Desulfobacterales bacterium]MCP4159749.1 M28 family peptidase [Deltaproteobacteria bacterium]
MKKLIFILVLLLSGCSNPKPVTLDYPSKPQNLKKHVEALVHDDEFRNFQNLNELNRVAGYIKSEIEKNGFNCYYQKYIVNNREYKNVVCSMGEKREKQIVTGAHYDVCGDQEGADDNASGVAGLIELSRVLNENRKSLKIGVELVAYTLEEPPFFRTSNMGSYIHAKSLADKKKDIEGMIALEMIGYFSNEEIQRYPTGLSLFYPDEADFIASVGNLGSRWLCILYEDAMENNTDLEVEKLIAPGFMPGVDFSDHLNYWKFGYDAMMITDTAFFRNSNYHKPTDSIDTLNFDNMAKVVDGLAIMLLNID